MSSNVSESAIKLGLPSHQKLQSPALATANSISLENWVKKVSDDLQSFGEAGRDILSKKRDRYKLPMQRTELFTYEVYSGDPTNPSVRKESRPWKDATDIRTMETFNESRNKYIDMKGKVWTYLTHSITEAFYTELDSTIIDQLRNDLDVLGLYELIHNHAAKGPDSKGIKTKAKLLTMKQCNGKILSRYLPFLNKWENVMVQLRGKNKEPPDEEKSILLVQAVWRPLFQ